MRRIKHYRLVDVPPVSTVRVGEKDLRLMRVVVRTAEMVNELTEDRCIGTKPQRIYLSREAIQAFQKLYRALAALNAPGKGRK